jgi:hypothetical protein
MAEYAQPAFIRDNPIRGCGIDRNGRTRSPLNHDGWRSKNGLIV